MTIQAMKQALHVMESVRVQVTSRERINKPFGEEWYDEAITSLRQAIAEAEKQEPVAWMYVNKDGECEQIEYGEAIDDPSVTLLYDHPQPKREPLTDDEFISMIDSLGISIDPVLAFEIKEIVETA
jgi:hypothetical protein